MRFAFPNLGKIFSEWQNSIEFFLEKIIRVVIYLSVFLIPLFFVPNFPYLSEFGRVILFYILLSLAVFIWLIKIFIVKRISFKFKFLDIPFIVLIVVYFFSSLFSIDQYYSFLGSNLVISFSFLTFLLVVIYYFLVSRFIKKISEIKNIFRFLIASVFFISIINILNLFWPNIIFQSFNLSINTFNCLLIIGLFLSLCLFFLNIGKKIRILNLFLALLFLIFIFIIDNSSILLLLIFSIFIFIFLLSFQASRFSNKSVIFLTCLLFVSVIVLILPVSNYTNLITPVELNLNNDFGWQITAKSLSDNFLLGVGPQNFSYSFYKYKPAAFNQTNFWQLGFEKDSNFWLELSNDLGVLGIIVTVFIFFFYLYKTILFLKKNDFSQVDNYNKFIIVCSNATVLFVFFIFGFFYNFDFLLLFLFFIFIGLNVHLLELENNELKKMYSNKHLINLFVAFSLILFVSFLYFESQLTITDIEIEQVTKMQFVSLEDFNFAENIFKQAISDYPERKDYNLKLANLLINKESFLLDSGNEFAKQELDEQIFNNLNAGFDPNHKRADNYFILNQLLDKFKTLGFSAPDLQAANLDKLIFLDPNNPELYIDRALLNFDKYSLIKDNQDDFSVQQTEILSQKIKNDLEKSIELKNDFVLGYFNLGLYYQALGDEDNALINIEQAYKLDPSQKIIVLSLKKLYLNQDKVEEAKRILSEYLQLYPADEEVRQMLEDLK